MLADRLLLRHPEVPNLQIPALINATQRRLSASRSWQPSAYALTIFFWEENARAADHFSDIRNGS